MDYFKRLLELLKLERDEDKRTWMELMRSASVNVRRANGMAWYPVAIRGSELSKAEYITVEFERTTHTDIAHQLRFGAAAMLFSNHNPQQDHIEGTITHSSGNRLKISFRTDELPDWADDGKLGIDLLFDDTSYDEMEAALKAAQAYENTRERDKQRLIDVLAGSREPLFNENEHFGRNPLLNEMQNEAVRKIVQAEDLAIVHGPPGTGKTTTLVQAIVELVGRGEERILVTAPSNAAVDLLSERLAAAGLNVLRVGNPARVSEELSSLTLDSRMFAHASTKEIKRLKKQASEFRDMAHKYKRNFGRAEREQRKALFDEANKILKDVTRMEQYITDDIVGKAQVVTATLVGSNHYTVRNLTYKTVVIDEAGQALEPACWIPILKGRRVVLAGDHCQLPPTIKSEAAARGGLAETLMEKCVKKDPKAVVLLQQQYRMHERIMGYSSSAFYGGLLQAHDTVAQHLLHAEDVPMLFVDTAGCGFEEKNEQTSISNPEEAAFVMKHLSRTVSALSQYYGVDNFPSIGVISPYREQLFVLKELLEHAPELQPYRHRITVNTIDSFQGQERDIVYLSMVRSNSDGIVGFLADTRRMNVAMTRARKKLVIIGDSATLSVNSFYAGLIEYAEQHGVYRSAWEEGYE